METSNNFWWIAHGKSFDLEVWDRGFIWRPSKTKTGREWLPYENIKKLSIGDIIFSYSKSNLRAIGIVKSSYIECKRPEFFEDIFEEGILGYSCNVNFIKLAPKDRLRIKEFYAELKSVLPVKYSPICKTGYSTINYVTQLNCELVNKLIQLSPAYEEIISCLINNTPYYYLNSGAIKDIEEIRKNTLISSTERAQLIISRLGQGKFKKNVSEIEKKCRITGVSNINFLIASHIKPWSDSNDVERLDGNNGFLLAPHIDNLFDSGYISFNDNGDLLISSELDSEIIIKYRLKTVLNVGVFSEKQKEYLNHHRHNIYKGH